MSHWVTAVSKRKVGLIGSKELEELDEPFIRGKLFS